MNNEENTTTEQKQENATPSLHTLEGDLLASMKDESYASNIVKIVTDGKGRGNNKGSAGDTVPTKVSAPVNVKMLFFIGLIVLIGIGAGVFYSVRTPKETGETNATSTTQGNGTIPAQMPAIFDADVVIPIKMADTDKNGLLLAIDAVKKDLLANKISDKTNITLTTDVTLKDFFNKILYSGRDNLIRSISADQAYNFGIYHTTGTGFESYLLIKVDTFDLAFSGMLDWEKSMPYDLERIFTYTPAEKASSTLANAEIAGQANPASTTTTGSTTPVVASVEPETPYVRPNFMDKVTKNIDTRVYTDPVKGVQITYGFINKKYLLITAGESSFVDILNKLLVKNVLR
jgi:hypothetical protein